MTGVSSIIANHGPSQQDGLERTLTLLRQCDVRKFQRYPRVRVARIQPFQESARSVGRHLRLHRRMVQPAPPAFRDQLSLTQRLRAANESSRLMSKSYFSTKAGQLQLTRGGTPPPAPCEGVWTGLPQRTVSEVWVRPTSTDCAVENTIIPGRTLRSSSLFITFQTDTLVDRQT